MQAAVFISTAGTVKCLSAIYMSFMAEAMSSTGKFFLNREIMYAWHSATVFIITHCNTKPSWPHWFQ